MTKDEKREYDRVYREKNKNKLKLYFQKKYQDNREEVIKRSVKNEKIRKAKKLAWVREYKSQKGCKICPEKRWWCLDFHHYQANKEVGVATAINKCLSDKRIKNEIDKCEVLCKNCHADVHHAEELTNENTQTLPE